MKNILLAAVITTIGVFAFTGSVRADEGSSKPSLFEAIFKKGSKGGKEVTKTVELRRYAFSKWEEHDCGIKMRGNYIKVTYQTFYSDGTSVVWDKEYRS